MTSYIKQATLHLRSLLIIFSQVHHSISVVYLRCCSRHHVHIYCLNTSMYITPHEGHHNRCTSKVEKECHTSGCPFGSQSRQPAYIRAAMTSRSLILTAISSSHASLAIWFADIVIHGRDHFSTYTIATVVEGGCNLRVVCHTGWSVWKLKMENTSNAACSCGELIEAMTSAVLQLKFYRMPDLPAAFYVTYKHYRALSLQTEGKARRTGIRRSSQKARNTHRPVR